MVSNFKHNLLDMCLYFKQSILIAVTIIISSSASGAANLNCLYSYKKTTFELPLKTLYAVHITRKFPKDGILRMSRENAVGRLTQHFSLGHMVTPHFWNSWEDMPMAILTPASSLKNQLVNIKAEDSFIIGDFKIPKGSIFIARDDVVIPENFPIPTIRFPSSEKIRATVQKFLNHPSQKFEDTPKFWKSIGLAEHNPSFKIHAETAFERIETVIADSMDVFYRNKAQDIFLVDLNEHIETLKSSLQEILPIIQSMPLDALSKNSLNEKLQKINQAINILEAENRLLELHKKTIRPLIPIHNEAILRLSTNTEQLWEYIMYHIDEWPLERSYR